MSNTILLSFQPDAMSPAQLAAVSYLARYSGRTHQLYAYQLRCWFTWCETNRFTRDHLSAVVLLEHRTDIVQRAFLLRTQLLRAGRYQHLRRRPRELRPVDLGLVREARFTRCSTER